MIYSAQTSTSGKLIFRQNGQFTDRPFVPNFEHTDELSPYFVQCVVDSMKASNLLILAVLQVVPFVAQLNISSPQLCVCRLNLLTIYVLGNTRLPQAPIESYESQPSLTCRRLAPTTGSGHQGPVPRIVSVHPKYACCYINQYLYPVRAGHRSDLQTSSKHFLGLRSLAILSTHLQKPHCCLPCIFEIRRRMQIEDR